MMTEEEFNAFLGQVGDTLNEVTSTLKEKGFDMTFELEDLDSGERRANYRIDITWERHE